MNEMLEDPIWLRERYWDEGQSLQEVAALVGCTPADIEERLRAYRLRVRTPQEQTARESAALTWRILDFLEVEGGAGILEISAGLDADPAAVAEVLRRLEVGGDVRKAAVLLDVGEMHYSRSDPPPDPPPPPCPLPPSPWPDPVICWGWDGRLCQASLEDFENCASPPWRLVEEAPLPPTGAPHPRTTHWRDAHGRMHEAKWEEFLACSTSLREFVEEILSSSPPKHSEGYRALRGRWALEAQISVLQDRVQDLEALVDTLRGELGRARMRASGWAGRAPQ